MPRKQSHNPETVSCFVRASELYDPFSQELTVSYWVLADENPETIARLKSEVERDL
jgi:hypothetical protein